ELSRPVEVAEDAHGPAEGGEDGAAVGAAREVGLKLGAEPGRQLAVEVVVQLREELAAAREAVDVVLCAQGAPPGGVSR
ncbi:MAG TPA: hypothetical protein PKD53_11875, partial [Chloroflexaceae bacterium]|nr:hypothetical protein [Chloroflexaceae bacterium]